MAQRFRDYVHLSFRAETEGFGQAETLDCEDFIFTGTPSSYVEMDDQNVIDLSELSIGQPAFFTGAQFLDQIWFNDSRFVKSVQFLECIFAKDVHFEQARFESRVVFNNSKFLGDSGFRETTFEGSCQFQGCEFSGPAGFNQTIFNSFADFSKVRMGRAYFHEVKFTRDGFDHVVTFDDAEFTELVQFHDTEFEGELSFIGCRFKLGEFIDVTFSADRRSSFNGVKVDETLIFKSTDPALKIFNHLVSFEVLSSDIRGQIIFEYTNIHFISNWSELRRLASPELAKIVVGVGCDPYKVRLEAKVPLEPKWRFLVEEMAETFVMFFDLRGALPVKVDCECEYLGSDLILRYFADADLTQSEFAALISERVPAFMQMLRNPKDYLTREIELAGANQNHDAFVASCDVLRKAFSLQMGLLARMQAGALSEQDLSTVLNAVGVTDNQISINFYQEIRQLDILSIGSRKIAAGRNLTIEGRSVS